MQMRVCEQLTCYPAAALIASTTVADDASLHFAAATVLAQVVKSSLLGWSKVSTPHTGLRIGNKVDLVPCL